jgi:hypothetical protein
MAVFWAVLVVPSLLWWKESLIFVILLSLYANFESSLAAHHALVANQNGSGGGDGSMCQGCSDSAGKACEDGE